MLHWLFEEKLVEDHRQPWLSFDLSAQYHVHVYPPMLAFYVQVIFVRNTKLVLRQESIRLIFLLLFCRV
jgi:hypothetical protein